MSQRNPGREIKSFLGVLRRQLRQIGTEQHLPEDQEGAARCWVNCVLCCERQASFIISLRVHVAEPEDIIRIRVCIRSPLPYTLKVRDRGGGAPKAVQR